MTLVNLLETWIITNLQCGHFIIIIIINYDMSSTFSSNSEAFASELLENIEEMFPTYSVMIKTKKYFETDTNVWQPQSEMLLK